MKFMDCQRGACESVLHMLGNYLSSTRAAGQKYASAGFDSLAAVMTDRADAIEAAIIQLERPDVPLVVAYMRREALWWAAAKGRDDIMISRSINTMADRIENGRHEDDKCGQ